VLADPRAHIAITSGDHAAVADFERANRELLRRALEEAKTP